MANKNFVVQNGLQVGPLTIDALTGSITTTGNLQVAGFQANITQDAITSNAIATVGLSVTGTMTTAGQSTYTGNILVTSTGNLVVANTAPSTSTSTGAFVVTGGAGVGGNLYIGGNLVVVNSASGNLTTANLNVTNTVYGNAISYSNFSTVNKARLLANSIIFGI
jgi:hypothetical protein